MPVGSERLAAPFLGGQGLLGTDYRAQAVKFDGSTYFTRGAQLTGAVNGTDGLFSVWFKIEGGDGTKRVIMGSAAGHLSFYMDTFNRFQILGYTSLGVLTMGLTTSGTYLAGSGWHHALGTYDLVALTGALYIDDKLDEDISIDTLLPNTINYADSDWGFGALQSGLNKWNGCVAEVFYDFSNKTNLAVVANRRKFITADKRPVFLGPRGEYPTGTVPIIYMKGDVSTGQRNAGSGGDFSTAAGGLSGCSSAP